MGTTRSCKWPQSVPESSKCHFCDSLHLPVTSSAHHAASLATTTVPDSDLLCTCAPMHRCPCIAACKPHPPGGESCHYTRTRCLQNDVCKEQRMGRPSYIHTGALWQQRAQAHATCRAAQNEVPGRAEHHSVHGFMWLCYSVL